MQETDIMTTWSEMKEQIEAKMNHDPQRATLASRAVAGIEDGLSHLMQVGYNFEIAPRGTLAALVEVRGEAKPLVSNPLSIGDAKTILATPKSPVNKQFEAMAGSPAGAV